MILRPFNRNNCFGRTISGVLYNTILRMVIVISALLVVIVGLSWVGESSPSDGTPFLSFRYLLFLLNRLTHVLVFLRLTSIRTFFPEWRHQETASALWRNFSLENLDIFLIHPLIKSPWLFTSFPPPPPYTNTTSAFLLVHTRRLMVWMLCNVKHFFRNLSDCHIRMKNFPLLEILPTVYFINRNSTCVKIFSVFSVRIFGRTNHFEVLFSAGSP